MRITKVCPFRHKPVWMDLDVTLEQVHAWRDGMLAQEAFPQLSIDEREFIITGVTPEMWEKKIG